MRVPDALVNPQRYPTYVVDKAYQRFFHRKGPERVESLDELSESVESIKSVWAEWVRYLCRTPFTHISTLTFKNRRLCPRVETCRPDDPAHRRHYGCGVPGMPTTANYAKQYLTHCERAFLIVEYGKGPKHRRHLHSLASFRSGSERPERRWPPEVGHSRQEIIRNPVGAIGYVTKTLVFEPDGTIFAKGLVADGSGHRSDQADDASKPEYVA